MKLHTTLQLIHDKVDREALYLIRSIYPDSNTKELLDLLDIISKVFSTEYRGDVHHLDVIGVLKATIENPNTVIQEFVDDCMRRRNEYAKTFNNDSDKQYYHQFDCFTKDLICSYNAIKELLDEGRISLAVEHLFCVSYYSIRGAAYVVGSDKEEQAQRECLIKLLS